MHVQRGRARHPTTLTSPGLPARPGAHVTGLPDLCAAPTGAGFFRDGYCSTGPTDTGRHVVCARVTPEFLAFTRSRGNDLQTPDPPSFPGLRPGDKWCLCALRWLEAYEAGVAPPVDLGATNEAVLRFVPLEALQKHALPAAAPAAAEPAGEGATVAADGAQGK